MMLWAHGIQAGPALCSHVVYEHGLAAHVHNCGMPAVLQNRAGGARSKRGRGGAERRGGGGGGARGLSAAAAGVCKTHDGENGAAVAAHPGCVALPGLACVPMQQGQLGGESVPGRRYQSQLSNQRWCVCSNISGSAAGCSGREDPTAAVPLVFPCRGAGRWPGQPAIARAPLLCRCRPDRAAKGRAAARLWLIAGTLPCSC